MYKFTILLVIVFISHAQLKLEESYTLSAKDDGVCDNLLYNRPNDLMGCYSDQELHLWKKTPGGNYKKAAKTVMPSG